MKSLMQSQAVSRKEPGQIPQFYTWSWIMCVHTPSTLCNPMDCSPPGSSVHGVVPGKNTGAGCHFPCQGVFPTQGPNPSLLHGRWILYSWVTSEVNNGENSISNCASWLKIMTKWEILWCSGRLKILTHKIKILIYDDFDTRNRNKVLVFIPTVYIFVLKR